jgi:hypothetical protein
MQSIGSSFLHNAHGWHEIQGIVASTGIDLTGWTLDNIAGISADATRIWGSGIHNGNREGVIVEFAAGYLAAYGASLPAQSIVGSYSGPTPRRKVRPSSRFSPTAPISRSTMRRQRMHRQASTASSAALTHGIRHQGFHADDPCRYQRRLRRRRRERCRRADSPDVLGNYFTVNNLPGGGAFSAPLVTGSSPIVGTWVFGNTTVADSSAIVTFFANGTYLQAYDGPVTAGAQKGMERGTYTWDSGHRRLHCNHTRRHQRNGGLFESRGQRYRNHQREHDHVHQWRDCRSRLDRVIAPPLAPSLAVPISRRDHGTAGTFDLVLNAVTTNPTTEPRFGPSQNVVFVFDKPVVAGVATVTEGAAVAGAPTFSGKQMTVPLSNVGNAQYVTVTASSVVAGGWWNGRHGFDPHRLPRRRRQPESRRDGVGSCPGERTSCADRSRRRTT